VGRIKPNYIIIPAVTVLVSRLGNWFTDQGQDWYQTLTLPPWTPPGWFIGVMWTIIFILTTASAMLVWNKAPRTERFRWTIAIFLVNAWLNAAWSYLFFYERQIASAAVDSLLLGITVAVLIVLIRPYHRLAAYLLLPYLVWVGFATYLNYRILELNKPHPFRDHQAASVSREADRSRAPRIHSRTRTTSPMIKTAGDSTATSPAATSPSVATRMLSSRVLPRSMNAMGWVGERPDSISA
jgi:translocator protein